ncbi:erythromycin esterase family protein [Streptomyces sp. NPDC005863]|uniref:erythromycin esterase family protein n=1 Tax=unclassified Streptomyces TaxID=2593676 RepID=UPI0034077D03
MTTSPSLPLTATALDRIARVIADGASVVGLGESTRAAHETFTVRDQLFRRLVREHGFRALAVQDTADAARALHAYVRRDPDGAASAAAALATAWAPWRTTEMAAALDWIRAFNDEHADDPVHIFGVKPPQASPADYDAVLDHVRVTSPQQLAEVTRHLDPIRTAHQVDEHVQRARGLHPGRPFADHADDALAIVERLDDGTVLDRMRLIADFHRCSVAGSGTYAGDAEVWGNTILEQLRRTGQRVAYWDGVAHTCATPAALGLAPERGSRPTVGSVLRHHQGAAYVSVAIGFHHGESGAVTVPPPDPDWIDARLADETARSVWVNLREEGQRPQWRGPARLRVISGVYSTERDAAEHLAVADLPKSFDVLIHINRVSPAQGWAS